MNLKFWKRRRITIAPLAMGSECDHLWTNWTDPSEVTVSVPASMFSAESRSDSVTVQQRRCHKCNLYQRSAI